MPTAADRERFAARYRRSLRAHLRGGGERPLHQAYELGRAALRCGFGMLELLGLHNRATLEVYRETPESGAGLLEQLTQAKSFLVECLSPYEMLQLGNKEANAALRRLNAILEEEARRIAHVLHDEAAQLLAAVYLELAELARDAPDSPAVRVRVARIAGHLDRVREQLRRLSHELRPPILDQLGLLPALEFLADGFRKRFGLKVAVQGRLSGRLSPEVETALYRVVQEALNNVTRHAHAHRVRIRVSKSRGNVRCSIIDDGVGFERKRVSGRENAPGLGLIGIRERVGTLQGTFDIRPGPRAGTELHICIPCGRRT